MDARLLPLLSSDLKERREEEEEEEGDDSPLLYSFYCCASVENGKVTLGGGEIE